MRSPRSLMLSLAVALLAIPLVAGPAGADTDAPTGSACGDGEGVTVVVDLSDLGNGVEVGCAEGDPATGREALESAGFTPTDSVPGMICAIDGLPDPCPEEFDGSYWAYWTTADGAWEAHQVGADGSDPAPGDVEGWRYNDGSTGPSVGPDELTVAGVAAAPTTAADDVAAAVDTETAEDPDDGPTLSGVLGIVAVAALVAASLVMLRRRGRV